ncbi:MAG: glutamate mutase L, partial [Armatimonadetes bacterium]|nr:glutamate mutase L [Anaerolineae bacterium]
MSILAVDFGSIHTRAVLLDRVDGVYELIARAEARTTDGFPVGDVTIGLDRVLRDISDATGRILTSDDGKILTPEQSDRAGVDVFVATASIGRPLRAVVMGLAPEVSAASALRAAAGTYVEVAATLHLGDGRDEQARLNAVLLNYPDVILIAGGTERGAVAPVLELVDIARLAILLMPADRRPNVIYAGNSALHAAVQARFEGVAKLLIAPNVRPLLDTEALDAAQTKLAQAFDLYKEERSQDFSTIAAMTTEGGVKPTAQSYRTIVQYLGKSERGNVLAVDVGSAASVLAVAV